VDRIGRAAYDVAAAFPFEGVVELDGARPEAYSHVVFVCGPFGRDRMERRFLR